MITLGERRDFRTFNAQFMFVSCKSVYNYILDIPFSMTLDVVASLVYLKFKYHNVHDEPTMIKVELLGVKHIHNTLYSTQKKVRLRWWR